MSVLERLRDAEVLFDAGRYEGSLLQLLVAVAATSRKRYPREIIVSDKEAFQSFLRDEMRTLTANPVFGHTKEMTLPVVGELDGIESHLYRYMRCSLVHEGRLDPKVRLVPGSGFFLGFSDPSCLQLSHWILRGLYRVLVTAPENRDDGYGRQYWQSEIVEFWGWKWWAAENWITGICRTETGIRAYRAWDSPHKTIEDLEREPDIFIVRGKSSDPPKVTP